jgi:uncharacterized phage-associated protein
MAYGDEQEQDFGMGGGRLGGIGPDTRAGPDNPDMPSPDVIAAIADQLNAAAAETQFGPGTEAPAAVAVNQQGDRLSNAQVQALINLQDQYQTQDPLGNTTSVLDTWSNPYVSQNYNDYAQAGQNPVGQRNLSAGLNYADAMAIDTRRQELMGELDRLNALSVRASDATQAWPSEWSQPDEWGMGNVQQGWTGWDQDVLGQPGLPDPNARRSWEINNPSPLTSVADYPAGDEFGMQDVRVNPLNPSPLTSVADYPGGDDPGMPNIGLTQASIAEGVMGAPGTYSGTVNPYDTARDASLAFDEYEMPSRQQQGVMRDIAQDDYMSTPFMGGPQFDSTMNVDAGSFPEDIEDEWGMSDVRLDQETERVAAGIVAEGEGILQGAVTKADLEKVRTESDMDELVTEAAQTLSKRLTKEEKKANVAARRKAEQSYVDFRDTLNFRVEIARSALATAVKDHGKKSDEAKAAKRNVRNKEADLRMWERSDLYIKSYGAGKNLPGVGTALSLFGKVEDYFHSLGKTERRSPEEILKDMKENPEKYEKIGAEVSAAQLVRNMYPFLRKAPMDVAAAAAREPAYLRYLINLNVNKQPIPTSYSSNWKNDISDAWIYG